jgi:hypothetical protein
MNRRLWIPTTIIALSLTIPYADAADHPFAGKWSSDSAVALKKWREIRDMATPPDPGIFGGVDQGLRGQRGGVRGGAVGTRGGRGFAAGQFGGQRGGNLGGGNLGGGNLGGGSFGGRGGQPGNRGGMPGATIARPQVPKLELPDGPPITADFKVDKKNVLTGNVVVSLNEDKDEKSKIEEGKVDGKKVQFTTKTKVGNVQVSKKWVGEMTTDNTIRFTRLLLSGEPEDEEPFALKRQK